MGCNQRRSKCGRLATSLRPPTTAIGILLFLSTTGVQCWADPIMPSRQTLTITSGRLFWDLINDDRFFSGTLVGDGFALLGFGHEDPFVDFQGKRTVFSGPIGGTLKLGKSAVPLNSFAWTITTPVAL